MTVVSKPPVLGMILKGYPRISESFISNEILLLERQGIRIHIFSMRHPYDSFTHKSVQQIRAKADYLPERILAALPQLLFYNLIQAVKSPGTYLAAMVIAFKRFLRTRKSATIKHLLQAGYLVQKLLPGSDVVHLHAHFAHSPTSVAMFASHLSGIEFSFTAHAKDIYTSHPVQLREKMIKARFVVTCTEYNRQHLMQILGNGHANVYRNYHGIDLKLFSGGKSNRQPQQPYHLVTVARLVPKKGLPTVYHALKRLQQTGIKFEHTLIGDGDEREKILKLIRDLELADSCKWMGTLAHEQVLEYYRRSDLFVLGCEQAANGDQDGIPNVFVESLATGLPVVSTRLSAIPELIETGKTGLLVQPGNVQEMTSAMLTLLTDSDLRAHVIASGREHVARMFNNRKLTQDLYKVYQREVPELQLKSQHSNPNFLSRRNSGMPDSPIQTRFGLIRHAQTLWNQEKLIQGQGDSDLTPMGRQLANMWGGRLNGQPFDRILSSDLGRTVATAQEINQSLQIPMNTTPDLRELDWGDWTGRRIQDIKVESPVLLTSLEAAGWQFCPPGGESREDAWSRARAALQDAARKWPGETILTVTHEGIIKCLLYRLKRREFRPHEPALITPYHLHWVIVRNGELFIEQVNAISLDRKTKKEPN